MALIDDENGSNSCATTVMNGFRIPHTIVIVKRTTTKRRGPGTPARVAKRKRTGLRLLLDITNLLSILMKATESMRTTS